MKIKSILLSLVSICGMFLLISCDSGSSSVTEWNPELTGQQQKNIALNEVSSDTFKQTLYDQLLREGVPPATAQSVTNCVQPETVKLIQNTPAKQFEVSEGEAIKLGEKLGVQAAQICVARIS